MIRKNNGCFGKGNVPWNKDTKGIMQSNSGTFGKRICQMTNHPSWKGGIQNHKENGPHINYSTNKRMALGRFVYMLENNLKNIPRGMIVYHKDGDKWNNCIDNLVLITRSELIKLNRKNY